MNDKPLTIFISAAEASGDYHAANLMRAIRRRVSQEAAGPARDVKFVGAAGPRMAAEGCEVVADLTQDASMVGGPFLRLGHYYRAVRRLQQAIRHARPDVVVPVDSPALNWHLAKTSRQLGIPVVYYIAPQVWAWAPWRVRKLARLTTAVACILPFEEEYLRSRGVNATYVGHPLFDDLGEQRSHARADLGMAPDEPPRGQDLPDLCDAWANGTWRVAFVPGSRPAEIRGHSPAMLKLAQTIRRRWPQSTCTFTANDPAAAKAILDACGHDSFKPFDAGSQGAAAGSGDIFLAVARTRAVLAQSHFGVVKSGTVTLEAAWFGLPMVIVYRTGLLMGALHRTLGRCRALMPTPHLSLVNILAKQKLVEELMPWHGNYRRLEEVVLREMDDLGRLCELRQLLMELVRLLQAKRTTSVDTNALPSASAADNAAAIVIKFSKLLLAQFMPKSPFF
jgi:lipid-A-disaccharide synthase